MKNSKTKQKQKRKERSQGGLMTISPPSKVKTGRVLDPEVLCSGVDTFYFTLDIEWPDDLFFQVLDGFKELAQKAGTPHPMFIEIPEREDKLLFTVLPNGTNGYKWIISGNEFAIRIADMRKPKSRPNAIVEIRSETLWRRGIRESVSVILAAIKKCHANILRVKANRIDLCMDLFMPSHYWDVDLLDHMVFRSRNVNQFFKNNVLTGVMIGRGKLSARLYDKELEIRTISQKHWMYEVWGIETIPENKRVIRVEFQLLRESIKELGIDSIRDAVGAMDNIWAYCTQKWLKFQTNPGKHHTQRQTLPWWSKVQNSFQGVSEPNPAIRVKAIRSTQKQLADQIIGLTTSLAAVDDEYGNSLNRGEVNFESLVRVFKSALLITKKSDGDLQNAVERKRAKNYHGKLKYIAANEERLRQELPADNLTLEIEKTKNMGVFK